jgi:hypothetical protein
MQLWEGIIQWNVIFTRPIQDWEVDAIVSSFERLYSFQLRHWREVY